MPECAAYQHPRKKKRITFPLTIVETLISAMNLHTQHITYIRREDKGKSQHVGNNYKLLLFKMAFLSLITPGRHRLRVRPCNASVLETPVILGKG